MKNNGRFFMVCAIGAIVYLVVKSERKRSEEFDKHAKETAKDRNFNTEAEKLTVKNDTFDTEQKILTGEVFDYYISQINRAKELASIKMFDDAFNAIEKLEDSILTGSKDEIIATFTLERNHIDEMKVKDIEEKRQKAEKSNYEMIADAIKSFSTFDFKVNPKYGNSNIRLTF